MKEAYLFYRGTPLATIDKAVFNLIKAEIFDCSSCSGFSVWLTFFRSKQAYLCVASMVDRDSSKINHFDFVESVLLSLTCRGLEG